MNKLVLFYTCMVFSTMILLSCATTGMITGGERDEVPPQVIWEESSPNEQVNYNPREIVLTFNEWIKLDNPFTQILISPPLARRPEIRTRGKSVVILLNEQDTLQNDVTYNINFGNAVVDLNENNPAERLNFVFSTGDHVDSMTFSGLVIDAETEEPQEDVLVVLYEQWADTILNQEKPTYAAQTDESGKFQFSYLRTGQFWLYAFKDDNLNFLWDPPTEALAFVDEPVTIGDTTREYVLRISIPEDNLRIETVDSTSNFTTRVTYNRQPWEIQFDTMVGSTLFSRSVDKTIQIYTPAAAQVGLVNFKTNDSDTISISTSTDSIVPIRIDRSITQGTARFPLAGQRVTLTLPVEQIDSALFRIQKDSQFVQPDRLIIEPENPFEVVVEHAWEEQNSYTLFFLPQSVLDYRQERNQDTIRVSITIGNSENFGNYILSITGVDSVNQYIVQVAQGNRGVWSETFSGYDEKNIEFKNLAAGDYELTIVEDRNRNGKWDPVNICKIGINPKKFLKPHWKH